MSFFNWFSTKSTPPKKAAVSTAGERAPAAKSAVALPQVTSAPKSPSNPADSANAISVDRKVKRTARREQLYSAIRESMTRAGMLSASYKFKVLSLDQNGSQFLVMMDVAPELSTGPEKLSQTEALLIQTANVIYNITVTAVYWRTDYKAIAKTAPAPLSETGAKAEAKTEAKVEARAPAKPAYTPEDAFAKTQANPPVVPAAVAAAVSARPAAKPAEKANHDPLLEAEVAAFKRALAAPAPTQSNAALLAAYEADNADKADKARSGLRSYTLITGFEDTEMPDSPAMPALSNTQYGELN